MCGLPGREKTLARPGGEKVGRFREAAAQPAAGREWEGNKVGGESMQPDHD